jgi:hypothetical protein
MALLLALSGCLRADWVAQTTEPVRGGVVKYPLGGPDAYAEDAYEKMGNYCREVRPAGGSIIQGDVIIPIKYTSYRYLRFTCY